MPNIRDISGTKFGRLTAIRIEYYEKYKPITWYCECECGGIKISTLSDLTKGHVRSCGCLKYEQMKGKNNKNFCGHGLIYGTHWHNIKRAAFSRDLEFNITIDYIWKLYNKQHGKCALSGQEIDFGKTSKGKNTASLDRIDSSKGYIEGNVQWVHKDINQMKMTFNQEYFIETCEKQDDLSYYLDA